MKNGENIDISYTISEMEEEHSSETFSSEEMLSYLVKSGTVDIAGVRELMTHSKREEILSHYTISKCKDGAYCANYYKEGKRRTIRRKNKEDVENFLVSNHISEEENPTIDAIFKKVQEDKLNLDGRKESTILRNDTIYKCHFSTFGKKHIKNIDENTIEMFLVEQKRKHDLTAKAYTNLKGVLRSIMIEARRQRLTKVDYEQAFKQADYSNRSFRTTKKPDSQEVYSIEEAEKIIDFLWEQVSVPEAEYMHHRSIMHDLGLLLLFYTGIRVGELAALKWDDFHDGCIDIRRTEMMVKRNGKNTTIVSDNPKTEAGNRTVPVPDVALRLFEIAKELNPNNEYIFVFNGNRIKAEKFRHRLKRVCESVGIDYKSPHKIRKTYATEMSEHDIPAHFLVEFMGHTNISVTQRNYEKQRTIAENKRAIVNDIFCR